MVLRILSEIHQYRYSVPESGLESGIVQKVQTYIAPKLFGGESAKTPIEGKGFPDPASAILLKNSEIIRIGDDFLIESEVKSNVHGNC